jgi:hypothetical protein
MNDDFLFQQNGHWAKSAADESSFYKKQSSAIKFRMALVPSQKGLKLYIAPMLNIFLSITTHGDSL